jgi:hypothetical protein
VTVRLDGCAADGAYASIEDGFDGSAGLSNAHNRT